jgi:type II secretory pathway pseudopilin PulG
MRISRANKIIRGFSGNESGFGFLEALAALAILGVVAVTFLSGLATTSKAVMIADEQALAEGLARSQLEYLKNYPYEYDADDYPVDPALTIPTGWSVLTPVVTPVHATDDGIQKITVTIQRNSQTVFVMEAYKVNR